MNDLLPGCRIEGRVVFHGRNIYENGSDPVTLRRRIGMVFQRPNPFPKSIYENVAYGPRVHGVRDRRELDRIVEGSLRRAALWDECGIDSTSPQRASREASSRGSASPGPLRLSPRSS